MLTKELLNEFSKVEDKIFTLNEFLYKNPELGYEEIKSHKEITKLISRNISTAKIKNCLLYTSPSPRDRTRSRMPSSA